LNFVLPLFFPQSSRLFIEESLHHRSNVDSRSFRLVAGSRISNVG
jgi:hypothetical protein